MLADVIYCCKMMSVVALDSVTWFLHLKDVTNACKCIQHSQAIGSNYSVDWWKDGNS